MRELYRNWGNQRVRVTFAFKCDYKHGVNAQCGNRCRLGYAAQLASFCHSQSVARPHVTIQSPIERDRVTENTLCV